MSIAVSIPLMIGGYRALAHRDPVSGTWVVGVELGAGTQYLGQDLETFVVHGEGGGPPVDAAHFPSLIELLAALG